VDGWILDLRRGPSKAKKGPLVAVDFYDRVQQVFDQFRNEVSQPLCDQIYFLIFTFCVISCVCPPLTVLLQALSFELIEWTATMEEEKRS
jgi:hypothetical protein